MSRAQARVPILRERPGCSRTPRRRAATGGPRPTLDVMAGEQEGGGYAGDVSPVEAFGAVTGDADALLLDVRTRAEWIYVGVPELPGPGRREVAFVEWTRYPDGAPNERFVDEARAAGARPGRPVYLLCRSGVRSVAAAHALTAAGLGPAYNVLDGFEGPHDPAGHRIVGGWKQAGLPWRQG
jgi:rhodanese-related sulfurtransferase